MDYSTDGRGVISRECISDEGSEAFQTSEFKKAADHVQ
jgi:hypothetical protein